MSLQDLVNQRYPQIKEQFPGEGRRKWIGRVLREYWQSPSATPSDPYIIAEEQDINDDDPFDEILDNVVGGVVVRTDYSDEEAWQTFYSALRHAEDEMKESEPKPEDDSSSDEDSVLLKVINPTNPQEQAVLTGISNLTALRLLNDVGVRVTPAPPAGAKQIAKAEQHPLIDLAGFQEVYSGVDLWIYDSKSNQERSVRVVSQEGDVYGTATGDSWRCQVSHIYELQFNMTYLSMKINFGGLDRWDYQERRRNLDEAKE